MKRNSLGAVGLIALVDIYRATLGQCLPHACRFHPTCSCYLQQALGRFGLFKGSWLGFKRLLRCHPWHPGGYDPVPPLED